MRTAPEPASPKSAAQLLEEARAGLHRLTPEQAHAAMRGGALLIDIRSEVDRARDGMIPGSWFIPRNVLEWRCDPASPWRTPRSPVAKRV